MSFVPAEMTNQQLEDIEDRLFEDFRRIDQKVADKQRQLRKIENLLISIVAERKRRENQQIDPVLQEGDFNRAVSPPVYADDQIAAPEDPSNSMEDNQGDVIRSGPFEIRRDETGEIEAIACDLGRHVLLVNKESESAANWSIREKNIAPSLLLCQSLNQQPSP